MPDTRGAPLPSEILGLLKDSSIQTWLRNFIVQVGSEMTIGRFPGRGSAQNDIYVYPDAADATHPYNFDYLIASNFQRIISAKLSFFVRPYRTYNTITGTNTGNTSNNHNHAHNHGAHSHNHGHTVTMQSAGGTPPVQLGFDAGVTQWQANVVGATTSPSTNTNAAATTPGIDSTGQSADHTHPLNLSQTLGITDGTAPVNPGITVSVDGTDITAAIGGPFNNNVIELDITQQLKTAPKIWHTLALQPNQNVRITGILRVSYYVDSRLAQ